MIKLIATFNAELLARLMQHQGMELKHSVTAMPYGQVQQSLLSPHSSDDILVVWTQAEILFPEVLTAIDSLSYEFGSIKEAMDDFIQSLIHASQRVKAVMMIPWCQSLTTPRLGALDWQPGVGIAYLYSAMNIHLADRLSEFPQVNLLPAEPWLMATGANRFHPKMWYAGKCAFSQSVFQLAASDILANVALIEGASKKLCVVDLDNTLWGGVIGDAGIAGIQLGGMDAIGEAFQDFQRALKQLKNRGILLAIASKNEKAVAMEAIKQHPDMVLREDDFIDCQIHWGDKAQSLVNISQAANIGLQDIVFIDDNPSERGRVKETLPDVFVPDWPEDPCQYVQALWSLRCFDGLQLSAEDRSRAKTVAADKARREQQASVLNIEEWLHSLNCCVTIQKLSDETLTRASQLLNKANQMNLSTRRLSANELKAWSEQENHYFYVATVTDRYADSGLTGLLSFQCKNHEATLVDFVLSCRVMGKGVEQTLLAYAAKMATELGCHTLHATLRSTAKNKPCQDFFISQSQGADDKTLDFSYVLNNPPKTPDHISLHEEVCHAN